jgi:hypothetical protein
MVKNGTAARFRLASLSFVYTLGASSAYAAHPHARGDFFLDPNGDGRPKFVSQPLCELVSKAVDERDSQKLPEVAARVDLKSDRKESGEMLARSGEKGESQFDSEPASLSLVDLKRVQKGRSLLATGGDSPK